MLHASVSRDLHDRSVIIGDELPEHIGAGHAAAIADATLRTHAAATLLDRPSMSGHSDLRNENRPLRAKQGWARRCVRPAQASTPRGP